MARNEQLIRQHKIMQILERVRYGKTLEEIRDDLVDELGLKSLHTRSVRRDLEALQAAGFDVDVHSIQRGRVWKLGPQAKVTHKITASATELIALSLGRDLLYPLAGTPFWIGIETFWNKINDELPTAVLNHFQKYRKILHVAGTPAKSYEEKEGILKTINRSIMEHRIVEVQYDPVGKPPSIRRIEPYAVVFYQSSLYIIAAACEVDDPDTRVRHWKLDRFSRATALDEWYKWPEDLDIGEHLAQSVGIFGGGRPRNFKIKISSYAAPWVTEDPWHPEQKIKKLKDGGIELTVKAAHELEIIPKVLALGGNAEVISPPSCREQIAETISKMAKAYKKK